MLLSAVTFSSPKILLQGMQSKFSSTKLSTIGQDTLTLRFGNTTPTVYPETMLQAIHKNDLATVEKLLEDKIVSIDQGIWYGSVCTTPLMQSIRSNNGEAFKFLLAKGANVNHRLTETWNNTPLIIAALTDNLYFTTELLKAGANPNLPDTDEAVATVALDYAQSREVAETLINAGTNLQKYGENILETATWHLKADIAELLLLKGVRGNFKKLLEAAQRYFVENANHSSYIPLRSHGRARPFENTDQRIEHTRRLLQDYDKIVSLFKQYE